MANRKYLINVLCLFFLFSFSQKVTADEQKELSEYNWYESPVDIKTNQAPTSESKEIYFGVFPQTVVSIDSDKNLLGKDKITIITISEEKENSVTIGSNTYFKGSDGEYYFKSFENANGTGYAYSDGTTVNQIAENSTRWFRVEPIKWRVLTKYYRLDYSNPKSEETYLLIADQILTSNIPFYDFSKSGKAVREVAGYKVFPSNYKYSQIRAFLTGDYYFDGTSAIDTYFKKGFLQTAFTSDAQNLIRVTRVRNDALSTTDSARTLPMADGKNEKGEQVMVDATCPYTDDKIFLLSIAEATNIFYGMDRHDSNNISRVRSATDFAKANNIYIDPENPNFYLWWLRSPYFFFNGGASRIVSCNGKILMGITDNASAGVVPALCISLP